MLPADSFIGYCYAAAETTFTRFPYTPKSITIKAQRIIPATDMNTSRKVSLLDTHPACMAGVRNSLPNSNPDAADRRWVLLSSTVGAHAVTYLQKMG
jgi:hypothetical protein